MKKHTDGVEVSVATPASATAEPQGTVTGTLVALAPNGAPLVEVFGRRCVARSCVPIRADQVGKDVVLTFASAGRETPIVLGILDGVPAPAVDVTVDGSHIALIALESITLRCGDASITLSREGKVVIRGAYVVSHSSGVNRIRGGSVELN